MQQLREAHGRYVAACQAASWQHDPASMAASTTGSVAAAVHHVLQATVAFVDSLASEG